MTIEDIEFQVNTDPSGVVEGFTLTGKDEFDSMREAMFCLSFMFAQPKGKARIVFEDGEIVFIHDGLTIEDSDPRFFPFGTSEGGVRRFRLTPEQGSALEDLLNRRGAYQDKKLRARPEMAWGKGFTLSTSTE